jgi:cytochrome b6-f complex iron-sulfur subunit
VSDSVARIAAFVDQLLRGRRPRRFRASPEEMAALQAAVELRSLRPDEDLPEADFIDRLRRQVRARIEPQQPRYGITRRGLLRTAGLAAAAGVAGAVVDRTLVSQPSQQQATLTPDNGTWRPVARLADVPAGAALRFSSGSVEGIVVNDGRAIKAVSAVCTHQGCLLQLDALASRLHCPCHPTVFSLTGKLVSYQLPTPPRNLPTLEARVRDGQIEVLVV